MKFLLKIIAFLALLLISKYTKENGDITSTREEINPTPSVLATYQHQGVTLEETVDASRKGARAIYK